jgi:hypothetical protein
MPFGDNGLGLPLQLAGLNEPSGGPWSQTMAPYWSW